MFEFIGALYRELKYRILLVEDKKSVRFFSRYYASDLLNVQILEMILLLFKIFLLMTQEIM